MRGILECLTEQCVNCGACAVACMDQNDLFPENGDVSYRRCVTLETGSGDETRMDYLSIGCMHCEEAACIEACPEGCLYKDKETGLVLYNLEPCTGCRLCLEACPVDAPVFQQDGKMEKCDGCIGRVRQGLLPACVAVCPYHALAFHAPSGS